MSALGRLRSTWGGVDSRCGVHPALRTTFGRDWGPPITAFALATLALWVTTKAQGAPFSSSSSWFRWDSGFYTQIASSGYRIYPCPGSPGAWCGNAGWFPGYPALLGLFDLLGAPQTGTAVLISWLFALGTLIVLWRGFLREMAALSSYLALGFAAFVPGGIYMRAAFPMAMTTFWTVLCLLMLRRRRWLWGGTAGALATFTYPSALDLAVIVGLWVVADGPRDDVRRRLLPAGGAAGLVGLGFLSALAVFAAQTGRWDAYFLTQAKYHHGIHNPFTQLLPMVRGALGTVTGLTGVIETEATIVAGICIALTVWVAVLAIRGRATRWNALVLLLVLMSWLFPLSQNNLSYWRSDTLLLPAALLVSHMPSWLAALVVGAAVAVFPFLAYFFFQGQLV
jgi:hypothetical protein